MQAFYYGLNQEDTRGMTLVSGDGAEKNVQYVGGGDLENALLSEVRWKHEDIPSTWSSNLFSGKRATSCTPAHSHNVIPLQLCRWAGTDQGGNRLIKIRII